MSCYKVIFAKNEIVACTKIKQVLAANKESHFEHHKGQIIHAIIRAPSEESAKTIAQNIIGEVKRQKNNRTF